MLTVWGEKLDKNSVLQEYPRPQLVRDGYVNLNGVWDYAITESDSMPDSWDGKILVPFSPECELSGVGRILKPHEYLWYRRELEVPRHKGRVILHFGAVDQTATVYVNGMEAAHHVGGYTAFECDITELLSVKNELCVCVKDVSDESWHSRGK